MPDTPSPNVPDIMPDYVMPASPPDPDPDPEPEAVMPTPGTAEADTAGTVHRQGECVANIPDVEPDLLSDEEFAELQNRPAVNRESFDQTPFFLARWLRLGYVLLTVMVAAVLGMFVFSQAISALSMAATLPEWQRWLLLTPLAFCSVVLLFVIASLTLSWFRLRRIRQIDLAALEELKARADSRRDGVEQYQAARRSLEKYLFDYPLTGKGSESLAKSGLPETTMDALAKEKEYLKHRDVDSQTWLHDFRILFQKPIDQAARARVNSWALRAGACVIASPLPLLDAILVLSISLRMIKDLCILYNVRTGGAASFLLFTRAVRNAFIAGIADEAGNAAGEALGEEMTGALGEGLFGAVGASATRVILPKLGEGALNALFLRRLGKAAIRMLQPLAGK